MTAKQNLTNRANMTERCRICLADNGCMISLRNERVESKLKDLVKCTFVDIKHEENLPAFVCHVCLYKLNMWSEFKERFIQSNKILLGQLQEVSDVDKNPRNGKNVDGGMRRKRLNENTENAVLEPNEKKKSKTEVSLEVAKTPVTNQTMLDTICISDNDSKNKTTSPKDSSKTADASEDSKLKENGNNQVESKLPTVLSKNRLLPGKRGRAIERRKASTKRWVERKKALLAATGEDVSDTDSIASDEAQMSPVQKARAKTNADKEAERQKRIAKVLKNLETNLTEKYTAIRDGDHLGDTDSDTRKTRFSKDSHIRDDKQEKPGNRTRVARSSSQEHPTEKENTPVSKNDIAEDHTKKSEAQVDEKIFTPRTIKSELMVGNDRYLVTSTLVRSHASRLSKDGLNNLAKNANVDDNNQEKNTDIIEAVQLRRVHPMPANSDSKKFERCLNVDVETTELESLKRVQVELADFVENEMKQKLFGTSGLRPIRPKIDNSCGKAYRKLDQQLKGIVGKTIISNVETSFMRDMVSPAKEQGQMFEKVLSRQFVELAKDSSMYQPIVIVERIDIERENKLQKINNAYVLKQGTPRDKITVEAISRRRQSIFPKRYNDFNTSALDSDSEELVNDTTIDQVTPKAMHILNAKKQGSVPVKPSSVANNQINIIKRMDTTTALKNEDNTNVTVSVYSIEQTPTKTEMNVTVPKSEKPDYDEVIKIEGAIAENHICGVCGITFDSRKDVETHVRSHKTINSDNTVVSAATLTALTGQMPKAKVKRCKRCQMLVDARYVKAHVCKTSTPLTHKCYVCNSTFRTEKLLVRHLENHDQSEFQIENIGKLETRKPESTKKVAEVLAKSQNAMEKSDAQFEKTKTGKFVDNVVEKLKDTYTCFVCDKIFTDEEILKDHLQKHCDDLSEGEQSNSKEQYQCAICGDTLESDQALEEHVGKHLFDDEDDNPNLISIEAESKIYQCGQCSQMFDSEVLLEIHVQEHEEEIAIAEWERKKTGDYPYECMLCGECIDTEEELAEHLDMIHNIRSTETHTCQLCDQPFNTLEELQHHVATH